MLITEFLHITNGSVVAVVGCGGKTSLIGLLAEKLRDKKVLISTTTKIFPPKIKDIMLCETLLQCEEHEPEAGIQCMGLLNNASGKLEALPEALLAELTPRYDIVLLEADGSRGLPCKGWLETEPVVPAYCTHTVGIVTTNAVGNKANESTVHRLREFTALTGVGEGGEITSAALEAMVCARNGMFKTNAGKRYVVVNQIEDEAAAAAAGSFLQTIKTKYPARFEKLLYGSVRNDSWREV